MKYIYVLTGIKRELVRIATGRGKFSDCWRRNGGHSSGLTIFSFTHIEGITLGASEEVDEFAGGGSDMSVDGIGKVDEGLVKDRLLGCMRQVLQQGLWQGGWVSKLVLTRS